MTMKKYIILLILLQGYLFANNLHIDNDRFFGFNSENAISSNGNEIYFTYLQNYEFNEKQKEYLKIGRSKGKFKNLNLKFENADFSYINGIELDNYNVFNFNKVDNKSFKNNSKIKIKNIYNNINFEVRNNKNNYEFTFELFPNSDINNIVISTNNIIRIEEDKLAINEFILSSPIAYYKEKPTQHIDIKYKLIDNKIKFRIGDYDKSKTIIIDPIVMLKSTYYGGIAIDRFYDMDMDLSQNSYATGLTLSTAQIAFNGHQNIKAANYDAFMVKFDSTGKRIWGTYFGGEYDDISFSNKVKGSNILMAGRMSSETFTMTSDAHQKDFGGDEDDGFWAEFDKDGKIVYATYYGGDKNDAINGIDFMGDAVYVTGYTRSESNIASGGHQNTFGGLFDAFLVRFEDGVRDWGTYLGGKKQDFGNNIVAKNNRIFIVGSTESEDGIGKSGYNNFINGKFDGFFSEFLINGSLVRSSYFGGSQDDFIFAADYDGTNLFALGVTYSGNMPSNTHQTTFGGSSDGFVAKFETNNLLKSTYYGGSLGESFYDIKIDDNVFIVGASRSDDNIGINSDFDSRNGNYDAVLAKFDKDLNINFGAYLGGVEEDVARGVFNHDRKIYITGYSSSANIFGLNGHQNNYNGDTDAFLSIFKDNSYKNIIIQNENKYCAGKEIELIINPDFEIGNDNVFKVYLSDINGDFNNKIEIYNKTGNANKLNINLPNTIKYSNKYKFQIETSKPFSQSISSEFIIYPTIKYLLFKDTICPNNNVNLIINKYPSSTTKWYLNNELIYSGDSLNYNLINSGNYKLKVEQSNDICTNFDSINVFVKTINPIKIIGDTNVCLNQVAKYSYTTNSKEKVNWTLQGGNIISQTDTTIFIEWNTLNASLTVVINSTNLECAVSDKLTINPTRLNKATIIGSDSSCIDCTEEYYVKNEYDKYLWTVEGGEIISSATLSNVIVKWKKEPFNIKLSYSKSVCEDIIDKNIAFLSEPKLQISPSINQVCLDEEIKFITSNADYLSFTWTVENAEIIEENNNYIIVKFNKESIVDIKLNRFNSQNNKSEEISKLITVNKLSNIDIRQFKDEYCVNEVINIINNNINHKLEILSTDYELISEKENEISINYSNAGNKELLINISDINTNCNVDTVLNFVINELPEKPEIALENNKIISSSVRNKWYENNVLLAEDGNVIIPNNDMTYYCYAINEFDCISEESSNTITYIVSSVEQNNLLIYPNPGNDYLEIKLNNNYSNIKLEIINLLGEKELMSNYFNVNNIKLNHKLKTGIYLLLIYSNDELINKNKIIINN